MGKGSKATETIFDEMKSDYDNLSDLWYSWLFSRLHWFIAKNIISKSDNKKILDIGCGTGFQTYLYALTGSQVSGIDISGELVEAAKGKIEEFRNKKDFVLFPEHFDYVRKYNAEIKTLCLPKLYYIEPEFNIGNAVSLTYENETFDHVNMCGSVINFIDDWEKALSEATRVLKRGGTFVIEFDTRWNADALWPLFDIMLFGKLGYDMSFREAINVLSPPFNKNVSIDYPFGNIDNPVYMPIKLFTNHEIIKKTKQLKLVKEKYFTIHSFTNIIPSPLLDTDTPSKALKYIFNILSSAEELNLNLPGCSSVILFRKI